MAEKDLDSEIDEMSDRTWEQLMHARRTARAKYLALCDAEAEVRRKLNRCSRLLSHMIALVFFLLGTFLMEVFFGRSEPNLDQKEPPLQEQKLEVPPKQEALLATPPPAKVAQLRKVGGRELTPLDAWISSDKDFSCCEGGKG